MVAAGKRSFHIALEQRGERFRGFPFGMLWRQGFHAVERESMPERVAVARTRACRRCRTWRCVPGPARSRDRPVLSLETNSRMDCFAGPSFHEASGFGWYSQSFFRCGAKISQFWVNSHSICLESKGGERFRFQLFYKIFVSDAQCDMGNYSRRWSQERNVQPN